MTNLFNKEDVLTCIDAEQVKLGTPGYFGYGLQDLITAVKENDFHVLSDVDQPQAQTVNAYQQKPQAQSQTAYSQQTMNAYQSQPQQQSAQVANAYQSQPAPIAQSQNPDEMPF